MKAVAEHGNPGLVDDTSRAGANLLVESPAPPEPVGGLLKNTHYASSDGSTGPRAIKEPHGWALVEANVVTAIDAATGQSFNLSGQNTLFGSVGLGRRAHGAFYVGDPSTMTAIQAPNGQPIDPYGLEMIGPFGWPHDESSQQMETDLAARARRYAMADEFMRWWPLYDSPKLLEHEIVVRGAEFDAIVSGHLRRPCGEFRPRLFDLLLQDTVPPEPPSDEASLRVELEGYGTLKDDWDGEGAVAPPAGAVRDAIDFLDGKPDGVPVPLPEIATVGDVGLYWDEADTFVEVQFGGDQAFSYFAQRKVSGDVEEYGDDGIPLGAGWPEPVVELLRQLNSK